MNADAGPGVSFEFLRPTDRFPHLDTLAAGLMHDFRSSQGICERVTESLRE